MRTLVTVSLAVILWCTFVGVTKSDVFDLVRESNSKLRSDHDLPATDAWDEMFSHGKAAIPFLLANFEDTTPYRGACGANILVSQIFEIGTVESKEKVSPKAPPTIREVSLYLVLAILKGTIYFAKDCWVSCSDMAKCQLSVCLEEIKALYESYLRGEVDFDDDAVGHILDKHGVHFKELHPKDRRE